jgi:hypothetical protein
VRTADYLKKTDMLTKKKKRAFGETFPDQHLNKPAKLASKVRVQEDEYARRSALKSSSEQFVEKPEKKTKLLKQRTQPESERPNLARGASASSPRPAKEQEKSLATSPSFTTGNIPQSSFPRVNSEIEKRLVTI